MASIISSGIGSGIDITGLVGQLVQAEGAPQLNRLNTSEAKLQSQLSAVGTIKGALSDFQSSLSGLTNLSSFQSLTATSGNTAVYTAAAAADASSGTHSIKITNIAEAHKVASKAFTDTAAVVGTGTLTFQFGTYTAGTAGPPVTPGTFTANATKSSSSVTIDSSNNSLEGIRNAVNNAKVGVSASIVNDGTGNRLIFTSAESGAANSLKISVSGDADGNNTNDSGLSQLAYDPTGESGNGKNMSQTIEAKDAKLEVDGLAITSATNTVAGAIPGVTINLLASSAGETSTLSVSRNTAKISSSVENFVSKYNSLVGTIKNLSSYDANTKKGGVLLGDATLRNIDKQIRSTLGNVMSALGSQYNSLSAIGISAQKDGSISLDSTKLANALSNAPDAVGRVFADGGNTTDALVTYKRATSATKTGDYAINITQAAVQGFYRGEAATAPTLEIKDNNNTFKLNVNGVQSGAISLTPKTYASNADLAVEMQTRINGDASFKAKGVTVAVSYDTDHFSITSAAYGSGSKVRVTDINAKTRATLGLSMGTGTQGFYTGGTATKLDIGDANDTFSLKVNGTQSGAINLTHKTYGSNDELAAEMQTRINADPALKASGASVTVGYDTDHFSITSSTYGIKSNVEITAVDTETTNDLGLSISTGTAGKPEFYAGKAATNPSLKIDETNNTFSLNVNGVQSGAIVLTNKTYANNNELATEMQTRINDDATLKAAFKANNTEVTVGYDTDHFTITSSDYSKVNITAVDKNTTANLGLVLGNEVTGKDIVGTIGGTRATQGFYTGKPATTPTLNISDTNNTFKLNVDGVQSDTITLESSSATKTYTSYADIAKEMQDRINEDAKLKEQDVSVIVGYDTDHFTITSAAYGAGSKVNITEVGTNTTTDLGLALGSGTVGKNVIGANAATGFGQLLTGTSGDSIGLQVEARGTATNGRGNVSLNRGIASQLNNLVGGFLSATNGALSHRTDEINSSIRNINTQRVTINERLSVIEKRYRTQFNAMDSIVASMKETGTYLTQQFFSKSNS